MVVKAVAFDLGRSKQIPEPKKPNELWCGECKIAVVVHRGADVSIAIRF